MSERIYLFDTTLRDGAQTSGVDFSANDKVVIAESLDQLGVDYIEGGWPGANPTDDVFFASPPKFKKARLVAFGMTRRPGRSAENDPGLAALAQSEAPALCLVGKSWDFHVDVALEIPQEENIRMIGESIRFAKNRKTEAMYDAEHFFDGYKNNPDYALSCLKAAHEAGADWVILCDTNGGTLPHEIYTIVREVCQHIPGECLGIHAHNDTGNAIANSLEAVRAGVHQVQGTINGLGERCGNADILALIPSLIFKMGMRTGIDAKGLENLVSVSRLLDQQLNRSSDSHRPYVGRAAFAHKGGLHVSAVAKDPRTYEHIVPELVGNRRHILVSDQAGRSNVENFLRAKNITWPDEAALSHLLKVVKEKENEGYSYDGIHGSFELLARQTFGEEISYFQILRFRVIDEHRLNALGQRVTESEATVILQVCGEELMRVAMGNGPINALDTALRHALLAAYPVLQTMHLIDYKVRIITPPRESSGTDAVTRVVIKSVDEKGHSWTTLGVSANIIEASVKALQDAYIYKLFRDGVSGDR